MASGYASPRYPYADQASTISCRSHLGTEGETQVS